MNIIKMDGLPPVVWSVRRWGKWSNMWDRQYREEYLIKSDAERVLTIDSTVWQNAFPSLIPDYFYDREDVYLHLSKILSISDTAIVRFSSEDPNEEHHNAFLGYDVADSLFTSALCNCGSSAGEVKENQEEWKKERSVWQDKINTNHLFSKRNDALQYSTFADQNVPEHMPFYIWTVQLDKVFDSAEHDHRLQL